MNANDYLEEVGDMINDPNHSSSKKTEKLRFVSAFAERFFARARLANEEMFSVFSNSMLSEADFTVDADDPQYAYATFNDFIVTNITNLWMRAAGRRDTLLSMNSQEERSLSRGDDYDHHTTSSVRYNLIGSRFELHGTIPNQFTIDVSYERIPPRLFIGKVSGKADDGNGNQTFNLAYADNPVFGHLDRIADRYVGTRIQGTSEAKASPIHLITGYAPGAAAAVITLQGLTPQVVDDDEIATIPDFPEDYHHLLALGAATMLAAVRGSSKLHNMLRGERNEALRQAIILLEQRTSETRAVHPLG